MDRARKRAALLPHRIATAPRWRATGEGGSLAYGEGSPLEDGAKYSREAPLAPHIAFWCGSHARRDASF